MPHACCIITAESKVSESMAAISETLRQARLRSGVDLDKLAAKTKINPRYLEAIETGNFDKLPGGIFARMFIKQYADAVGLDLADLSGECHHQVLGIVKLFPVALDGEGPYRVFQVNKGRNWVSSTAPLVTAFTAFRIPMG